MELCNLGIDAGTTLLLTVMFLVINTGYKLSQV